MDPHFFSSFLNANDIVWLNDFFSRNFFKHFYLKNIIANMFLTWLSNRTEYIYKLKVLALKQGALGQG